MFWPLQIWRDFYRQEPPAGSVTQYMGRDEISQPKVPGQIVPIGVIKQYNIVQESAEKRELVADSTDARSCSLPGQLDQNFKG